MPFERGRHCVGGNHESRKQRDRVDRYTTWIGLVDVPASRVSYGLGRPSPAE